MITIGAFEYVDIPLLNLEKIKAKIDTGAGVSAIHAPFIDTVTKNGTLYVIYKLLNNDALFSNNKFKTVNITNSFGDSEIRYQVPIKIKINNQYYETDFTLSDRNNLEDKILIGKDLIRKGDFIVNIKKNINESLAPIVKCDNCGHTWEISKYDINPNLCHICMFDNLKGKFMR